LTYAVPSVWPSARPIQVVPERGTPAISSADMGSEDTGPQFGPFPFAYPPCVLPEAEGRGAPTASGTAKRLRLLVRMAWYAPLLLLPLARVRAVVDADVARWVRVVRPPVDARWARLALLATYAEFRTLTYYRLRRAGLAGAALSAVAAVVYPGERTLHLDCSDIGPGLFIQHGFATVVAARSVGANCWINQQVTIGFTSADDRPVLGDDVFVYAGAKVLGDVVIGEGARVGANAVVLTDVPPHATAVGVPARTLPPKDSRSPRAI
jgi:serine O-acetyltransferase